MKAGPVAGRMRWIWALDYDWSEIGTICLSAGVDSLSGAAEHINALQGERACKVKRLASLHSAGFALKHLIRWELYKVY